MLLNGKIVLGLWLLAGMGLGLPATWPDDGAAQSAASEVDVTEKRPAASQKAEEPAKPKSAVNVSVTSPAANRRDGRTAQPAIAPMKEDKSPGIAAGFVFYQGRYVPPPYVIRVEGDTVTLNRQVIAKAPGLTKKGEPLPTKDPGEFHWTPELRAMGVQKSGFMEHAKTRFWYWYTQYGFDEAGRRYLSYLRSQEGIKSAVRSRSGRGRFYVIYVTSSGERRGAGFTLGTKGGERRKNAAASLERQAAQFRQLLSSGGALLSLGSGAYEAVPPARAKAILPELLAVLASNGSSALKEAELVERKLVNLKENARALSTRFEDHSSLRERLGLPVPLPSSPRDSERNPEK